MTFMHIALRGDPVNNDEAVPEGSDMLKYETGKDGGWVLVSPAYAVRLAQPVPAGQGERKAIVFIHGHNCTRLEAQTILERMMTTMERSWGRHGHSVDADWICLTWDAHCNSFTMPEWRYTTSWAGLVGYADDLDRIALSFRGITMLLRDIANSGRQLHIIAHSMGCQAVVNFLNVCVLDYRALTSPFFGGPYGDVKHRVIDKILDNVRSVAMIAPDVPVGIFRVSIKDYVPALWDMGKLAQISIFANSKDWAIWVSQFLRLGRSRIGNPGNALAALNGPFPVPSPEGALEIVDVESHSWIGHDIYDDHRVLDRISYRIANDGDFPPEKQPGATNPPWAPQVLPHLTYAIFHEVLKFRNPI